MRSKPFFPLSYRRAVTRAHQQLFLEGPAELFQARTANNTLSGCLQLSVLDEPAGGWVPRGWRTGCYSNTAAAAKLWGSSLKAELKPRSFPKSLLLKQANIRSSSSQTNPAHIEAGCSSLLSYSIIASVLLTMVLAPLIFRCYSSTTAEIQARHIYTLYSSMQKI